jgi:hypothetical protein
MSKLPNRIEAYEYEETCGSRELGGGILMMDDEGAEICRLTQGTIREKKIALLWQAAPQLLEWAKEACEAERAFYDGDDDRAAPSWLAELDAAVKAAEGGEIQ